MPATSLQLRLNKEPLIRSRLCTLFGQRTPLCCQHHTLPLIAQPARAFVCRVAPQAAFTTLCIVQRQSNRTVQLLARNPRYDDDYVEIDEEDSWSNQVGVRAFLDIACTLLWKHTALTPYCRPEEMQA